MAFLGNKNFPINTIMVTLKFIFIFFLIFVIAILLRNRSNFISTTPKLKAIAKLESQVTISNDDKNTRIKKMSNYYLEKLKNEIKNTGSFLEDIEETTKENGCIDFSSMSASALTQLLKNYDEHELRAGITKALETFNNDYSFLITTYYKIPKNKILINPVDYNSNSKKRKNIKSLKLINYYLTEVIEVIDIFKSNFDSTNIDIYSHTVINDTILTELNKINLKDFPLKITTMIQKMDMSQCKKDKKCCV